MLQKTDATAVIRAPMARWEVEFTRNSGGELSQRIVGTADLFNSKHKQKQSGRIQAPGCGNKVYTTAKPHQRHIGYHSEYCGKVSGAQGWMAMVSRISTKPGRVHFWLKALHQFHLENNTNSTFNRVHPRQLWVAHRPNY